MKKIVLATAFTMAASSAFAGGLSDPIIEEPIIEAATSSSAGGILVPLLALVLIAAVASS